MKNKQNTVNILGTEYKVEKSSDKVNPKLMGNHAYIELYSKKIIIDETAYDKPTIQEIEDKEKWCNKVLRHEGVHGLLHESGLSDYSSDERLVEWIAQIYPKMKQLFKELGAEE